MICYNCGNYLPEGTQFCNNCGASQAHANQPPMGQQPPMGYQPNVIISQAPGNPPAKKKKRTGLIIGLVVLGIVIAAIVAVVIAVFASGEKAIERGYIDDSSYINESINIQFDKGYDWTFLSDEELAEIIGSGADIYGYSDFEQAVLEQSVVYAMGAQSSNGDSVLVMIEDMTLKNLDENEYIDVLKDQLNTQSYLEYELESQYDTYLAGENYTVADFEASYYSSTIYQRYYLRRQGKYMIGILVSSDSSDIVDDIEYMFSSVE